MSVRMERRGRWLAAAIIAGGLLMADAAGARDWRLIGPVTRVSNKAQQVVGRAELDASSITVVDGIVKAWVRESYPREVTGGPVSVAHPYFNSKIQFAFECGEHRAAVLVFIGYGADARVTDTVRKKVEEARWIVVSGGSEQVIPLALACEIGKAQH